jgi:hypothetical protein
LSHDPAGIVLAAGEPAKKLVANVTEYEKRPAPYLELREKIAGAIEALSN